MKKKQTVLFKGKNRAGQTILSPVFERIVMDSVIDPVPTNRKSKRAMDKIIEGIGNDIEQEDPKAIRKQKEERKAKRKAVSVSRRLNRAS